MATYKAVAVEFVNSDDPLDTEVYITDDAQDLVNIDDPEDRVMAAPEEFELGELVTENDFHMEERMYTDDQGYGAGMFAFKNLNK